MKALNPYVFAAALLVSSDNWPKLQSFEGDDDFRFKIPLPTVGREKPATRITCFQKNVRDRGRGLKAFSPLAAGEREEILRRILARQQ
jgi:hypothetical protein